MSSHSHLRALRHIRKLVYKETAMTVASAMVQGRLDYCNSELYLTSAANIRKLQRIQNSLARIVTGTDRSDHITPIMARLHWLPIGSRMQFKLAVVTYKVLTTHQPGYLVELLSSTFHHDNFGPAAETCCLTTVQICSSLFVRFDLLQREYGTVCQAVLPRTWPAWLFLNDL
jgi:hypothetical protein